MPSRKHNFILGGLCLALAACSMPTPIASPAQPSSPTATALPNTDPPPPPTATPVPQFTPAAPPSAESYYAGWAVFAYPDEPQAQMEATLRRMKDAGANFAWIGHNNPGEVSATKNEPGLSYAVWAAAQAGDEAALAILESQHRMLRAARAVALPVVLPIGYQIHMGQAWNDRQPQLLRHDAAGQWLNLFNGGISASPYSAEYRRDIRAYYEWVRAEFVGPYRDVIMMLNLADEPLGGDYSQPAEAELRARTGLGFAEAGAQQLGAFQDNVIVDYAVWSAQQWLDLAPDLPVTMSFCGSQGRWSYGMPNVEALFRDPPRNFVPSFDAYVHDYLPWEPLTEAEVGSLALFTRTLGYFSQQHEREFWLWSAGNRWGLAGYGSSNPGGVSDAVANGYLLALAARSTGGGLRGLAVWNYNVREQGLYGDADPAPYDREAMFARVSESFADWRGLMAGPGGAANIIVYLSRSLAHRHLGTTRSAVSDSALNFDALLPLTRQATRTVFLNALPCSLAGFGVVVVLDPSPETISAEDIQCLSAWAEAGGHVYATEAVLEQIKPIDSIYVRIMDGSPLTKSAAEWAGLFPGDRGISVVSPEMALVYLPAGERASLPAGRTWRVFDVTGAPQPGAAELQEHEFALSP
jgi:hypothetical protein